MAAKTETGKGPSQTQVDQSLLKMFFERRHPAYEDQVDHWKFLDACYRGGRSWFKDNIWKYYKEGEKEYSDRLDRAYRFNHTREVVQLVNKYLFKAPAVRNKSDAPEEVISFWEDSTLKGLNITALISKSSVSSSISGRCAVVVDHNMLTHVEEEDGVLRRASIKEAEEHGGRVYAYVVPAKDILDYAFDEDGDGKLLWIKIQEHGRDDYDPIHSTGQIVTRVRLWTREGWTLYREVESANDSKKVGSKTPDKQIITDGEGYHGLGEVPVKLHDHTISDDAYMVPGLIDDVAYLDRAVANYLSSLDAIIQDQTFSQLAIPAQSVVQGDNTHQKVVEMGTKRIFVYDAGAGSSAKPMYLSPDPKQAGVILSVISKIVNEIYHTVGLAGERTKEDNSVGIDNSSGVAKAYDFERVNSLLLAKAQSCEEVENWLSRIVMKWHGKEPPKEDLVTYPTTFDVMRLVDDLVTAEALAALDAPAEVRREQMRGMVPKAFPQAAKTTIDKINRSVNEWLTGEDLTQPPSAFADPKSTTKPVAAPSRQGSVTADTE